MLDELMELQDLDTTVAQVRHRIDTHPERAHVTAAAAALAEVVRAEAEVGAERSVIDAEQRRLEREVADLEAKAAKVNDQLYGGSVTSPKELEALQHELGTLAELRRGVEDRVLEQMEAAEPIDARLEELAAAHAAAEADVASAEAALTVAVAELEVELAGLVSSRDSRAASLPADLVATYDGLRVRLDGVGAARLNGGRCEGCHLTLAAVDLDAVRHAPADSVVNCPECGRILVR